MSPPSAADTCRSPRRPRKLLLQAKLSVPSWILWPRLSSAPRGRLSRVCGSILPTLPRTPFFSRFHPPPPQILAACLED